MCECECVCVCEGVISVQVVYVPDGEETTSPVDTLPLQRMAPCKSAPPFLEHSSPTPERDAPPTQSLPTNQINASKKNLEHTRSQELHPKISLDVSSFCLSFTSYPSPSLLSSLPPSLPPSLTHSLTPSFLLSLPHSLTHSLLPSLPPSLPPSPGYITQANGIHLSCAGQL